jgi:hypothetical protein
MNPESRIPEPEVKRLAPAKLRPQLEEVSKLLESYPAKILDSGF